LDQNSADAVPRPGIEPRPFSAEQNPLYVPLIGSQFAGTAAMSEDLARSHHGSR
jgi:hypothetical protein